jgi:uncharacterized repeat protein (TIGR03837 family)
LTIEIQPSATSLTLFCKVIDNFGDIGICWRLARQLVREHKIAVTLWVDDLSSFQRICPAVLIDKDTQQIDQVTIRHWRDQNGKFMAEDVSDIVIEFFGCDLPPSYLTAMAARNPHPVWLNLEGLSAEKWVEGCHKLASPHPSLSLTKYFFFPGFTNKTGGLLLESGLLLQRQKFQQNPAAISSFLEQLGVTPTEMTALKVSLFCYPHAPIPALFNVWQNGDEKVICLVPEGVASEAIQTFLGQPAKVGASVTKGALTVRVIPFLSQPDYDKLLWACDLNFVRGEDSFARAQWAARPFIWHIYPQDKNLHHVKLNAFLQCLVAKTKHLVEFSQAWNAAMNATTNQPTDFFTIWPLFKADMPTIVNLSTNWQQQLTANGDLASNLMQFAGHLSQNRLQ